MSDLKNKATNAFVWDMIGVFSKQGISFIVSIFLARLLSPTDFGLVSMAMVFIALSQVFADFGFTSALIQHKDSTSITYSSIFYVNIVAGIILFTFFWFLAPFIADFYGNEELSSIIRFLSISFVLGSFNQVQQTILRRNIEFRKITIRALVSYSLSGIIGIICAFSGFGVYALVIQTLSALFINTIILWRVAEWHPKLEFSWIEVKKLTEFGMYVFFSQVTNKLVTQVDTLVVGKVFSPAILGFYNRAASLNSLVTTFTSASISKISFPVMSKIREEKERFERAYFQLIETIAFGSFALSGCLMFAGKDLILTLFGDQWVPSVFIFQILVLKSFTYPISLLIVNTFLAAGKSKENFWYGNIKKAITLSPLAIAVTFDFNAFLYAIVVAAYLNWILNNWFVTMTLKISLAKQCKSILKYLSIFGILLVFIHFSLDFAVNIPFFGTIKAVIFLILYFVINWTFKTQGFHYSIDYSFSIWKQLRKKLGPI